MTVTGVSGGSMRSTGPTPALWPPPESMRPTLIGSHYMVSAGHPLVAEVGARAFEQGANAIDAGVAAGIAANVVQVDMCNFGGVAPILVRVAGQQDVWSVAGLGHWGSAATVEAHRERHRGDMPAGGPCAIVPGAPAAWVAALRRFGTWGFAEAAAFAVELAGEGFPLDLRLAESLEICGGAFSRWESSRSIYWPQGRPPRTGERLVQADLAGLLKRIGEAERDAARGGASREEALDAAHRAFYEGEVARRIVEFVTEDGGWMTLEDLARFEAEVEPTVSCEYGGWSVAVTGPWTQGPALLQALRILERVDLVAFGHNSADYLHVLTEAIKLAFSDRERFYGDPRRVEVPLEWLLSDQRADELRARIGMRSSLPNLPTLPDAASVHLTSARRPDTTCVCTADALGNAFSAALSDTLDGAPIVSPLGILVSPRGVQSRLDPRHPARVAPHRRPRLTPAPALATRGAGSGRDALIWPLASPGGDVIVQAVLQAFLNVVHFDMTAQQAVEAPRVACFSYPDSFFPHVEVEDRVCVEGRIGAATENELRRRGHEVVRWPAFEFDAGAVSLVFELESAPDGARVLAAGADPRRSSYAQGR
jgi:gamma-glutamyltranspeptidase / glutathione hydrolase